MSRKPLAASGRLRHGGCHHWPARAIKHSNPFPGPRLLNSGSRSGLRPTGTPRLLPGQAIPRCGLRDPLAVADINPVLARHHGRPPSLLREDDREELIDGIASLLTYRASPGDQLESGRFRRSAKPCHAPGKSLGWFASHTVMTNLPADSIRSDLRAGGAGRSARRRRRSRPARHRRPRAVRRRAQGVHRGPSRPSHPRPTARRRRRPHRPTNRRPPPRGPLHRRRTPRQGNDRQTARRRRALVVGSGPDQLAAVLIR
jgi:hypothetical protein